METAADALRLPSRVPQRHMQVHGGVPYRGDDGNQHLHGVMVNRAWGELFEPSGFGPMPDKIRSSVHGEMFVTAAAVRAQPREFYLQALQWMKQSLVKGPWNRWEPPPSR